MEALRRIPSAIFPDALIQTQKGYTAQIDADGTSVTIQPETMVQFEGLELVLDHGSLHINTIRGTRVRVNCITIIPLTLDRTQYDVTDVDGKVHVVAAKDDVKIHAKGAAYRAAKKGDSPDVIVREGEQSTRTEKCGAAKPTDGVAAEGPILDRLGVKITALAGAIIITCLGVCRDDDPISPWTPKTKPRFLSAPLAAGPN